MWSFRECEQYRRQQKSGLNPCFVGMWSFSYQQFFQSRGIQMVLILVLLGCDLLVVLDQHLPLLDVVLILVLLGCGLLEKYLSTNPAESLEVLILVLLECGLLVNNIFNKKGEIP